MAHDVFISHSNSDRAVADAMCSRLEQAGVRCWIAPRDVRPGRNWGSEIIRGLDNAQVMIVVLSANSNCSRPVIKEVERAFGKGIVIIPVRTEEVVPSEALEFFLSSEQWLDAITPPLEPHLDRLAHTVKEYLIERGWKQGTAASAAVPPATAEPISKESADEIPPTDAVSRAAPSVSPEPPLIIFRSAQEEATSSKEAAEKAEEEKAPPPQTQPPAPASGGTDAPVEGLVTLAKAKDADHDAPSRFAPPSAPLQSGTAPVEDAKTERPTFEEPSDARAIPVLSRQERFPFFQTPKGWGVLAASAGLVVAVLALIVMRSESQTKRHEPYASPTATPGASTTRAAPGDFLNQTPITLTPGLSPTPNVANRAQVAAGTPLSSSVSGATKEHPFVNSLSMNFVPVPGTNVLFSVWETRVGDYQTFCDATGKSWKKPSFQQTADHPAVNVSWEDATAFCEWLSRTEGKRYRLPTDHEWSCAVGIGDQENADATPKSKNTKIADIFPWGKQWPPPNDAGNYLGEESKTPAGLGKLKAAGYGFLSLGIEGFNDGNVFTTAVGSFRPNGLGIYDLGGDVWEWCQDKYEPASAWRVLRGGSWDGNYRVNLLSSGRNGLFGPGHRSDVVGFRAVVEAGSGR